MEAREGEEEDKTGTDNERSKHVMTCARVSLSDTRCDTLSHNVMCAQGQMCREKVSCEVYLSTEFSQAATHNDPYGNTGTHRRIYVEKTMWEATNQAGDVQCGGDGFKRSAQEQLLQEHIDGEVTVSLL